jgi:gamma-glutamyltranspeptidase/glutathione hydrolase
MTRLSRRTFGAVCGAATANALRDTSPAAAQSIPPHGAVRGEPTAEQVGQAMLASGGNAIDAAVAAALAAAVVAPHQTGIGGYGGHMTLALATSGLVTSIDFNSIAPAAARDDMFPLNAAGKVIDQKNMYGWLAAGVPGIVAGLQLAISRFGTKRFRDALQPAIGLAEEGFQLGTGAANSLRAAAKPLAADPGSQAIYFRDGQPLSATDRYRNPELARLLKDLAADDSVESFYRGDIARQIAAAFQANGGLVTAADLAAYQAREREPLKLEWGDWTIHTAPLTAGGATILEAFLLLQNLGWADRDPSALDTLQLQVEAFRYAWQDRLQLLGDPTTAKVPIDRLLDRAALKPAAGEIEKAVAARQPLPVRVTTRPDQGTISLSLADREGNLVAVTLTHGGSFGARVTVPGLGLTLGHGMSRFDPHPGHPNAPGPHKRPLNNMCPTIVTRGGRPMHAIGGRGGRKIPNAVAEVLLQLVARDKSLADAVRAPRLHTEGTLAVSFEHTWPAEQLGELKNRGYTVSTAASATVSAVGVSAAGRFEEAMR